MATTTSTTKVVAMVALVVVLAVHSEAAQVPAAAPGPAVDPCVTALFNMSDCLSYVQEGSKARKPDKACCPELAGLVDSNPICLCNLLGNPGAIGIKIDVNRALKLPSICGVSTPPVSTCAAVGVPVSLPPSSEASSTPSGQPTQGPATSPPDVAAHTATTPANQPSATSSSDSALASPAGGKDNGASSIEASALPCIIGLATAIISIFF